MSRTVHILAVGARTPVGLRAESTAAAVRASMSRLGTHPFMIDQHGENVRAALDHELDSMVLGAKRLPSLIRSACDEVLTKLAVTQRPSALPLRLFLALPETRPGFSERDARDLLAALEGLGITHHIPVSVQLVDRGHAGGIQGLAQATRGILDNGWDVCLVGGVDTYIDPKTIEWLQVNRQLTQEDVRNGFTPGEGAAVVALGDENAQHRLGLKSLGVVRGFGTATETKLIKTDAINLGEALTEAVLRATGALRMPHEAVDAVYCDINGERFRTEEWGFVVLRGQQILRGTEYVAPADCWGDVGAASGPLFCVLAVQAWARSYAAGPRALIWAGSEGGLRGAAVLEAPARRG